MSTAQDIEIVLYVSGAVPGEDYNIKDLFMMALDADKLKALKDLTGFLSERFPIQEGETLTGNILKNLLP
ncbi:hypothetical protein MSSIH_2001 [Methanosarcina siciliae HI350]|uniref:Uncharacterized protein n=2 Tax=Methanosarcina siciliae TaxID=38027 RepID=A0A0E3LAV7_9EURY|nr:hypothetical protein MSSIH_2001 [Methanosarcina siciliae HI350]